MTTRGRHRRPGLLRRAYTRLGLWWAVNNGWAPSQPHNKTAETP